MIEYPKSLYLRGWDDMSAHVIVRDRAEEDAARAGGYRMLTDPPVAPAGDPLDGDGDGAVSRVEVMDALSARGIAFDGRWGIARLRALLEAAP